MSIFCKAYSLQADELLNVSVQCTHVTLVELIRILYRMYHITTFQYLGST